MARGLFRSTGFAAFAAGWSMMSLEILSGRLMAPVFGQTVYQWGALIGTALAFMSAGYWLGGRLGSGPRASTALPVLLLAATLCAACTPWFGLTLAAVADAYFGPMAGAVAASAILLGLPAFALAAVSPLCVARLALGESAALASGTVSALGSGGSIGGTFFAAFFAVPYLGLTAGYVSAAGLAALAAVVTGVRVRNAALAMLPLFAGFMAERNYASRFAEYVETPYNTIMVRDTAQADYLYLNNLRGLQSARRKDGSPTGLYWDKLAAAPALATGKSVLFLGVAGGVAVEATAKAWPGITMTGVEIDPGITAAARRWFGLTIPVTTADARRFIAAPGEQYDVIVVDLYATVQIPSHLATREFYAAVARRLAPGGVVAANVFGAGQKGAIVDPVTATMASVFPGLLGVELEGSNTILLAWNKPVGLSEARSMLAAVPETARNAAASVAAGLFEPTASSLAAEVLTDERSDLEVRAARAWNAMPDDTTAGLLPHGTSLIRLASATRGWIERRFGLSW